MSKTRRNLPFSPVARNTSAGKGSLFGSLPSPDFPPQTTPYHSRSLQHAEATMTQLELLLGAGPADHNWCGSEMAAKIALAVSEPLGAERAAPVEDDAGLTGKRNDDDTTKPVQIIVALPTGATTGPAEATAIAGASNLNCPILHVVRRPDTLDEAIAALRESGQFDTKLLKRLTSDVHMATKLVHRTMPTENARPPSLPCGPVKLRDHLAQVLPARHRMTAKRWSSIKSSVAMVLKLTGWHASSDELRAPLTSEWQAAANMIGTHPQRALIAGLGRFCAPRGILPADVTEQTLERLKAWRSQNTLDPNIRHSISSLRCIWNRAQRASPDWPGRRLVPPPDPREYVLPLDEFDPGFLVDLNGYLTRLQTPSPFDPVFNRKKAPLTLTDVRGSLLRAASVLVRKGVPVTSIRDVVTPSSYKAVLLEVFERLSDGKKWPSRATSIAGYLCRRRAGLGAVAA